MFPFHTIRQCARRWLHADAFEREMAEEMRLHLEQRIEQHVRGGLSPRDAREAALRAFGSVARVQDECRDQRRLSWALRLAQDVRHGVRHLTASRGFAAVVVLTLGLGIGANAVVFSVARAVLLRPLGFDGPDRLLWIRSSNTGTGVVESRLSAREVTDIREETRSFESVAMFAPRVVVWDSGARLEELPSLAVTPGLADVLRVRPVLGRALVSSDADESAAPVLLVSHELWQARFGGGSGVIGHTIRLDEKRYTIVGVLPPGLVFPLERAPSAGNGSIVTPGVQAFWLPLGDRGESRSTRMFPVLGRLRPDASPEAASAELATLGDRLARAHPGTNRNRQFDVVSLRDQVLGRTRQGIPLLAAAVAAVLLICCVNLANLLLARGLAGQRELAVRMTLGASRGRLVQAFLVETVLLSLVGGALALVMAEGALRGIRAFAAAEVPFVREANVDSAAVLFTVAISVVTAFVFGLLPALRQSRVDAAESLSGGARTTVGPGIRAWQGRLLVAQLAVVLVLLTSAGLLLESFRRLIVQDLGYAPRSVVAIDLSTHGFPDNSAVTRWYRALHARLEALPGVEAVGTISSAPLTGKWTFEETVQVVGRPVPEADRPSLGGTFVAFDYFEAMGIPVVEGRVFRAADLQDDQIGRHVILNEAAARSVFAHRSAIGEHVTLGAQAHRVLEVVGVVKDTRDVRLDEKPQPRFYLHYPFGGAQVVVRSAVPARTLVPQLRAIVEGADRRVILRDVRPMAEIVSATLAERRFLMAMLGTYAALALAIAAVGIFGVVACQVAQRRKEFGVRLALGASPRAVAGLVVRHAARLTASGLAIGLVAAAAANRLVASQVFDISPHDPVLLLAASATLMGVGVLAALLPAWRAAHVDPMEPLRGE